MSTETSTSPTLQKLSDQHWGYKFGCDGLVNTIEAAKLLGVSTDTVERLYEEDGKLRKGKLPGKRQAVAYCRRSVMNLIAEMEL